MPVPRVRGREHHELHYVLTDVVMNPPLHSELIREGATDESAATVLGIPVLRVKLQFLHDGAHGELNLSCLYENLRLDFFPLGGVLDIRIPNCEPIYCELRKQMNNFPPSFDGLVLGCIDADCCK